MMTLHRGLDEEVAGTELVDVELLGPVDTAWFRMEEARNPVDIVGVFVFAGALDHARFREVVARRLLRSRRFGQRLESRRVGRPRWVEVADFSIDDHLSFHRLANGSREALESAISDVTSAPFDVRRPLWEVHVYDGYQGERSVLVARLHHAMGDGYALMGLVLAMADEAPPRDRTGVPPRSRLTKLRSLRAIPRSAAELVMLSFDPPNDLRARLSGRRLCTWSEAIPLDRIKASGRRMHATVNDVVLTALAGALRRYLTTRGDAVDSLAIRAVVPVNLRPIGQPVDWERLGNFFGLVYLDLPVHLREPRERLAAVQHSMVRLKRSPEAVVSHGVLFALGFVPTLLSHVIDDLFAKKASVVATNVPGPKEPISFAQQRVDEAIFFVPHPGKLAVGASIFSYAGSVRVGIRVDAAVVSDPHALSRAFEEELAALLMQSDSGVEPVGLER